MTASSGQLQGALDDYLRMRRAMGYSLTHVEKLLTQFLGFLSDRDTDTITVDDTLTWVRLPVGADVSWLRARMSAARGFLTYLHTLDDEVPVPAAGLLLGTYRRSVPYLFSDADIAALLIHATRLRTTVRVATIQTLISLLSVTGMRISEAIDLDDSDVDTETGLLLVRHAKGGRERLIPLHPSTMNALSAYQYQRDQRFGSRNSLSVSGLQQTLFVSIAGTRLRYPSVSSTFATLVRHAGLHTPTGSRNACLHDLRHSFAVHTLLDWYRDGGDIPARLPLLSTYLGHSEPASTYWYLQAAPELMAEATARLENAATASNPR
jgi:integrase/recombinase XerD